MSGAVVQTTSLLLDASQTRGFWNLNGERYSLSPKEARDAASLNSVELSSASSSQEPFSGGSGMMNFLAVNPLDRVRASSANPSAIKTSCSAAGVSSRQSPRI